MLFSHLSTSAIRPLAAAQKTFLGLAVPAAIFVRTATKRGGGSSKNGRNSSGKRLGVKKYGGEVVKPGNIIVRQRGLSFKPGQYVGLGKDYTLFATAPGFIQYYEEIVRGKPRKFVGVALSRSEKLPVNEAENGRSRFFGGVDVAAFEKARRQQAAETRALQEHERKIVELLMQKKSEAAPRP